MSIPNQTMLTNTGDTQLQTLHATLWKRPRLNATHIQGVFLLAEDAIIYLAPFRTKNT